MRKLKYYVYCLIDPTNEHKPFYVGKGTENRVGVHLEREVLSIPAEERNANDVRREYIESKGAKAYERLFMWDLSEESAFAVETALINLLPDLTNISQGQNLLNVRRKEVFPDWHLQDDVDLVHRTKEPLDYLDAQDTTRSVFFSKTVAYNAAGSAHKLAKGPYHTHFKTGIKMWTGNLNDVEWDNQYDEKTGNYYIGGEKVVRRHGSWDNAKKIHQQTYTRNKLENNNKFLCFTYGLSPRGFIKFLGIYQDDWEQSIKEERIVRKLIDTKWSINNKID